MVNVYVTIRVFDSGNVESDVEKYTSECMRQIGTMCHCSRTGTFASEKDCYGNSFEKNLFDGVYQTVCGFGG